MSEKHVKLRHEVRGDVDPYVEIVAERTDIAWFAVSKRYFPREGAAGGIWVDFALNLLKDAEYAVASALAGPGRSTRGPFAPLHLLGHPGRDLAEFERTCDQPDGSQRVVYHQHVSVRASGRVCDNCGHDWGRGATGRVTPQ